MNICIVNCFDTYEHRVDLLLDAFKSQGHKAIVLSSDFRHIEKVRRTERKKGYKFFPTKSYTKNMSIQRMRSHSCFSKDVAGYIERHIDKIDLIWALIPPNSLVKDIAKIKSKYPGIKLIYDLIDLWPETMPVGRVKNLFPFTYWRDLRDQYIRSADCVVTESSMSRHLKTELPSSVLWLSTTSRSSRTAAMRSSQTAMTVFSMMWKIRFIRGICLEEID